MGQGPVQHLVFSLSLPHQNICDLPTWGLRLIESYIPSPMFPTCWVWGRWEPWAWAGWRRPRGCDQVQGDTPPGKGDTPKASSFDLGLKQLPSQTPCSLQTRSQDSNSNGKTDLEMCLVLKTLPEA